MGVSKPKNTKKEKAYLPDSCFPKLRGMSESGLTKYSASGKVQEEIKTPSLRKERPKWKWTVLISKFRN